MKALRMALAGLLAGAALLVTAGVSHAGTDGGGQDSPPKFWGAAGYVQDYWHANYTEYWTPNSLSGTMRVCDLYVDGRLTEGEVMAAFTNGSSWSYPNTRFLPSYDGKCRDHGFTLSRPNQNYWLAYVRVTTRLGSNATQYWTDRF